MNFHSGKLMRLLQSECLGLSEPAVAQDCIRYRMDLQLEVEPGALARVFASNLVTSKEHADRVEIENTTSIPGHR
jgi:hypothetical protein